MDELTALVAYVTATLTPALPYLLKAGALAGQEACKQIGTDAWKQAKRLWSLVGDRLKANSATQQMLTAIAEAPANENTQAELRFQLKQLLAKDKELTAALQGEILQAKAVSIKIGEVKGNNIFTGKTTVHGDVIGRDSNIGNKPRS